MEETPSPETAAASLAALLTPEGMRLLDGLGPYREDEALQQISRLRAEGFAPELISAAMTQSRLRTAAAAKFGEFAQHMLFTQDGLEQATRLSVSAVHASRYVQAGVRRVADLGCGIGADAMTLASAGLDVTAVELDETTAAVATVNLTPFPETRVVQADVQSLDLDELPGGRPEALWLDPARRETAGASRRIFDPEAFSPPLSFVEALADSGMPVGVKMGPGLPHAAVPEGCEAQWISHRRDVVEVVLWFGALARPGIRRAALVMGEQGHHELVSSAEFPEPSDGPPEHAAQTEAPETESVSWPPVTAGNVLWEPDGAVIRAGLVQDLAGRLGARLVHPRIAYLTAPGQPERDPSTPYARAYRVREVLPHTVKVLKTWVKRHRVGTLEIKKRGTDVTPEQLRRQLKPSGPNRATLIVTRLWEADDQGRSGERRAVLVVEPMS
ncbi:MULTISPECIES: class I SAM-dependent methyltransferase [Kocuria]|uniref:class I SAM-dependent methyltransferase n=1 Tax=Kocuria TaxID=57493 RepID=UPI000A5AB3E8|nr:MULTISPECIES: class I SAM-dependent methyltransferase [Kocuria]MCM3331218.1 class I SAM-dependent methyltransferase [Kocuria palustris]MCT1590692.1 class I SAM-dependent methyltransferase [Kocuria palustris]